MKPDWSPLQKELAQWRAAGRVPRIWWRDDDAVSPTPALDRLERLAEASLVPVHLAVIPRDAQSALPARLCGTSHLLPVVHGWAHENHAGADAKKSEFGAPRAGAKDAIRAALARMQSLFGARLLPVFVPPWNRLDTGYLPDLAEAGYRAVSTFGSEPTGEILPFVNTQLDPIDWHGTRGVKDPEALIALGVADLESRRCGRRPDDSPFGLLTHHLVHDDGIWQFCAQFLHEMRMGGAVAMPLEPLMEPLNEQT